MAPNREPCFPGCDLCFGHHGSETAPRFVQWRSAVGQAALVVTMAPRQKRGHWSRQRFGQEGNARITSASWMEPGFSFTLRLEMLQLQHCYEILQCSDLNGTFDECCFHCWEIEIETLGVWMLNNLSCMICWCTWRAAAMTLQPQMHQMILRKTRKMNYWKSLIGLKKTKLIIYIEIDLNPSIRYYWNKNNTWAPAFICGRKKLLRAGNIFVDKNKISMGTR